ncbi:MAG: rRNA maturation RNase YbeY [Bacteroidales bacterium]|nr:rRNA maturation RNase YbeY [Bacteroidales bacterium]
MYYSDIKFRIGRTKEIKSILESIVSEEGKIYGDVSFIITSDENILIINKEFLNHDFYTDVITFDYCEADVVNGEIYISIDTVRNNSKIFKVKLLDELFRVMIHGVLHLCGYDDKTDEQKVVMRQNEEKWLARLYELNK